MSGDEQGDRLDEERDRPRTPFTAILERLVEETPGAVSATFADEEGEAVDYHGPGDPIETMLAAAHMGLLINKLEKVRRKVGAGPLLELRLSGESAQYVTRPLGRGYQVTVVLDPVATFPKLDRALELAMVQLRLEAGGVID